MSIENTPDKLCPHAKWESQCHICRPINNIFTSDMILVSPSHNDLRNFADDLLEIAFEGNEADGATIQEIAEKYGLLKLITMTEPCRENCICAEVNDFPLKCYRKTY